MRTQLARCVALALALASVPVLVDAQGRTAGSEALRKGSRCEAEGLRCLFGRAGGCNVTCETGTPLCIGARCIFGFPQNAECTCEGVSA